MKESEEEHISYLHSLADPITTWKDTFFGQTLSRKVSVDVTAMVMTMVMEMVMLMVCRMSSVTPILSSQPLSLM